MARNPAAVWDPLPSSSGGAFTGGPRKGVAHKTQGATYAGARATYLRRSLGPHFTIDEDGVLHQHLDTGEASSAVANESGGVQTNRDGAIQVELVGFSGVSATPSQLATFVDLQHWLEATEGIPIGWPAGRPPANAEDGYGEDTGHRQAQLWDTTAGWYGHSQVPENEHWDPAWTDDEWAVIAPEDDDMDQTQDQRLAETHQATTTPWGVRLSWQEWGRLEQLVHAAAKGEAVPAVVDEAELAALLAPMVAERVEDVLSAISDADVERIAKKAADEQDRRARERLSP